MCRPLSPQDVDKEQSADQKPSSQLVKQSKWKNARLVKTLGALNIDKNKKNNSDKNAKLVYKYFF